MENMKSTEKTLVKEKLLQLELKVKRAKDAHQCVLTAQYEIYAEHLDLQEELAQAIDVGDDERVRKAVAELKYANQDIISLKNEVEKEWDRKEQAEEALAQFVLENWVLVREDTSH